MSQSTSMRSDSFQSPSENNESPSENKAAAPTKLLNHHVLPAPGRLFKQQSTPNVLRSTQHFVSPSFRSVGADERSAISAGGFQTLQQSVKKNREFALTNHDLQTLKKLGSAFNEAQQEHEIQISARVKSTGQCTLLAFAFWLTIEVASIIICMRKAGYTLSEAMLFTHYTMTTSGYGNYPLPDTPGFQIFLILLMLFGIASVTILVSQTFQYLSLSRSWVLRTADKQAMRSTHSDRSSYIENKTPPRVVENIPKQTRIFSLSKGRKQDVAAAEPRSATPTQQTNLAGRLIKAFDHFRQLIASPVGRAIFVFVYLIGLLVLGAVVMTCIEGWTFIESLYFASFTMTTIGYGDVTPTLPSSTWFAVFWLPFNVSFLSVFMGNLVRLYAWVSSKSIRRIESKIHQEIEKERAFEGSVRATALWVAQHANGVVEGGNEQEATKRALANNLPLTINGLRTMKDVIWFVRNNMSYSTMKSTNELKNIVSKFLTIESTSSSSLPFHKNGARNPSFVLLVMVQERFAQVIATEIAGFQSHVQIRDDTAALTVDALSETAKKWCVPQLAQKAFLTVAFETILYIGHHQLLTQGAEAMFALSPLEFHELMSPLLAALGDAGTMEGWLAQTEHLASLNLS